MSTHCFVDVNHGGRKKNKAIDDRDPHNLQLCANYMAQQAAKRGRNVNLWIRAHGIEECGRADCYAAIQVENFWGTDRWTVFPLAVPYNLRTIAKYEDPGHLSPSCFVSPVIRIYKAVTPNILNLYRSVAVSSTAFFNALSSDPKVDVSTPFCRLLCHIICAQLQNMRIPVIYRITYTSSRSEELV